MNIFGSILTAISYLPFSVLHRLSDITYFFIYYVLRYRKKVVFQNLKKSFPEKNTEEILLIQKKFYQNFCDLIFETIKTFSISKAELDERCVCTNPGLAERLFKEAKNIAGISSHMGNWEWLSLSLGIHLPHDFFAIYKPIANTKLNDWVIHSRERFGAHFVAIKKISTIFDREVDKPYMIGLLSDQAPHDYAKAFQFHFLNQDSYFVTGPGLISVQNQMVSFWGWMRRTGRSRYQWGVEVIDASSAKFEDFNLDEQEQINRMAKVYQVNLSEMVRAFHITKVFVQKLEAEIKMAPQDWLWSHRRWKLRN